MKKLGMAFIMALLALTFVAVPVLADGGSVSVTCGEITVTDDSPAVGTTITFYGTVDIVAQADSQTPFTGWNTIGAMAYAESSAWYKITAPDGTETLVSIAPSSITDVDWGTYDWCDNEWTADADASYTYTWSEVVYVDQVGEYLAEQGGDAYAYYGHWEWLPDESTPNPCDYTYVLVVDNEYGPTSSECAGKAVIACSNAPLATGRTRPILTVLTSEDKEVYFPSEGWGDPTTDDIVYNDGTWQVEIADGTKILLDGEWHRKTWIEVDDQGNVIGRYGSDGHIVAEEIALSSPITITKVG